MQETQTLGKYRLDRHLATGGMAQVFQATVSGVAGFEKKLVVKVILPQLAEDARFVDLFLNEARLAAHLNHPNIVQIFELGVFESTYFIAMEYIDGPHLRLLLRRAQALNRVLPLEHVARIIAAACEALVYAHELPSPGPGAQRGVVHRDISADNILLSRQGALKIVDFGIARAASAPSTTRSGTIRGKLSYIAPEILRGEPADKQTDLFALGIVMYELITGQRPFKGSSEAAVLMSILEQQPTPVRSLRPDVPQALADIVDRSLAKRRSDRYPDCRALKADLERFIMSTGRPAGSHELATLVDELVPPFFMERQTSKGNTTGVPSDEPTETTRTISLHATPGAATPHGSGQHGNPPKLRFEVRLEGRAEDLLVHLSTQYGGRGITVEPDAPEWVAVNNEGKHALLWRDRWQEAHAIDELQQMGLAYRPLMGRFEAKGDQAIDLWTSGLTRFPKGWRVIAPEKRVELGPPVLPLLDIGLTPEGFTVTAGFRCQAQVDPNAVVTAVNAGRRFLKAGNVFVRIDEGAAHLANTLAQHGLAAGAAVELPPTEASTVLTLIATTPRAHLTPEAEAWVSRFRRTSPMPTAGAPQGFRGALRGHDEIGLGWLDFIRRISMGGVLADDDRVGQRTQALALCLKARWDRPGAMLIVARPNAIAGWEQHAAVLTPTLSLTRLVPGTQVAPGGAWLCSYDELSSALDALGSEGLECMVLDDVEVLAAVEPALRARLASFSTQCRIGIAASAFGTDLDGLWPVFDVLVPGLLEPKDVFFAKHPDAAERVPVRVQPFLFHRRERSPGDTAIPGPRASAPSRPGARR